MAKLTPKILDEIAASFHRVGGEAYLDELAMRDPQTFCLLLGKVLQAEIKAAQPDKPNTLNLSKEIAIAEARLVQLDVKQ